jgi:hypothetical protein
MSYRVRIERITTAGPAVQWQCVSRNDAGEAKYDYVQVPGSWVTKSEEIYDQTVDDLDVFGVILAVNGKESEDE